MKPSKNAPKSLQRLNLSLKNRIYIKIICRIIPLLKIHLTTHLRFTTFAKKMTLYQSPSFTQRSYVFYYTSWLGYNFCNVIGFVRLIRMIKINDNAKTLLASFTRQCRISHRFSGDLTAFVSDIILATAVILFFRIARVTEVHYKIDYDNHVNLRYAVKSRTVYNIIIMSTSTFDNVSNGKSARLLTSRNNVVVYGIRTPAGVDAFVESPWTYRVRVKCKIYITRLSPSEIGCKRVERNNNVIKLINIIHHFFIFFFIF